MLLKEKLLSEVVIQDNGCWKFTGCWDGSGYGQITHEGRRVRAHVASYEVHKGPVPTGLYVLHTCDNRWCTNPEHLWVGTHVENIKDMWNKGRGVLQCTKGEFNGQAKLYEKDVVEIRYLASCGDSLAELSRTYSVDITTIWKIVHRKTWRHL